MYKVYLIVYLVYMKTSLITIRIPVEHKEMLTKLSAETNTPASKIIAKMIERMYEKQAEKAGA